MGAPQRMSDGIQGQNQLVTVNESNEAESVEEGILAPEPAQRKNFMDDTEVTEWVRANVISIMPSIRGDYASIHDEWTRINNMLTMKMEDDAKYKGETQVYLPTFAKAIETRAAHVCKSAFPTDSYMDALALRQETPEQEAEREATKAWMKKQIEDNAKLRSNMKPFVRNVLAYGFGILKEWWEDELVKQNKRRHRSASLNIENILAGRKPKYCGKLRCKTVNNFSFYAYPLSVDHIDQCTLVFEDIQVSKQFVDTMIKKNYWKQENITLSSSEWDTEGKRQVTLDQHTNTTQTAISGGMSGDLGQYVEMSECWFKMFLPQHYFTPEEIGENAHLEPVPMKAVICGNILVDLQYNPFNHGQSPYLTKKLQDTADVLIPSGYGRMVMTSQYLVNDLVNQVNDNGIYALNPIVKRIIGNLAGHSLAQKVGPGANFDMNDKDGISFDRPPIEQIQYGIQLLQLAKAEVNDPIAPPSLQGSGGSSGAAKTATGAQLLQNNTNAGIADFNEDMEATVFKPFMERAQELGVQFESEEMFFAITGKKKLKFTPEMLTTELSWQWVASSQTVNQQLRGQQMGLFLQAILNPLVMQTLMQKGISLDIIPILRKMWEDGLGQRAFEQLMSALPQQPAMGGMPGQPPPTNGVIDPNAQGVPGGPQLSPEQISPVSQNPNASVMPPVNPAAGEGEMFRSVRDGAEGISGAMGGLGNAPKF